MKEYDAHFYSHTGDSSGPSAKAVAPAVLEWVPARSVLDIGCGVGTWLAAFSAAGVPEVLGLDGDWVPRDQLRVPVACFQSHDLSAPIRLQRKFDLVISLEVAEHLPASRAESFVEDLCHHGDFILFSAAIPGQGGDHHVNEQWPSYWCALFARHGFVPMDLFRARFWADESVAWWYPQNTLLFALRGAVQEGSPLAERLSREPRAPLDLVHPKLYLHATERLRNPSFLGTVLSLPGLFSAAVKRKFARRESGPGHRAGDTPGR